MQLCLGTAYLIEGGTLLCSHRALMSLIRRILRSCKAQEYLFGGEHVNEHDLSEWAGGEAFEDAPRVRVRKPGCRGRLLSPERQWHGAFRINRIGLVKAWERTLPACPVHRRRPSNLNGLEYRESKHARCVRSQAKAVSSRRRRQDAYKVQAIGGALQIAPATIQYVAAGPFGGA